MDVPYGNIDVEMREMIQELSRLKFLQTIGCCIGHDKNPVADVIFKVKDEQLWHGLMIEILKLNTLIKNANIDIYEWHRIDNEGQYLKDWKINIEVHPRNKEISEKEEHRLLRIKNSAIDAIINLLKMAEG